MPRKNKRKFFFGKSKKSKSAKLENQNVTTELENQRQSDSDEEEDNNAAEKGEREKAKSGNLQKSAVHASISSVTNDSASELGGQIDANSQLSLAEVNAFKMGTATSSRWRSEPILNVHEKENRRVTITLKIIHFIPKAEVNEGGKVSNEDTQKFLIDNTRCVNDDDDADHHKSTTIKDDTVISEEIAEQIQPSPVLHVDKDFAFGEVPKLDHAKEEKRRRLFNDNYRVESPKQHQQATLQSEENRNKRRHAMLIQEISESSSSEEVKQFLDAEASALEMKSKIVAVTPKIYRVDSPESSSNDEEVNRCKQSSLVQEICESSSNESVKNEILASLPKQPSLTPTRTFEPGKIVTLKIINIKELPPDNLPPLKTPASPVMKHKPIEKKLNKAEEAIMEALYGNPNLLQIPNTPLDVISEEGSDCSDIERHSKINHPDIDDDDEVFLPSVITKSAESSKFKNRRRVMTANAPPVEQPTMLINTKIIEAESNVLGSCKTWETNERDSELQAELVYLPSTSSSATDLSERSGDITDPEDSNTSEDTETNSLLENISVPSLHDTNNVNILQQACELYIDSEQNYLPLPDIIEESDDLSQKSLELIESQQQIIEDVNKELHHLVSYDVHVEVEKKNKRREESMNKEIEVSSHVTETLKEENLREDENKAQKIEPNVIVNDKKLATTTDNEQITRQTSSNSGTPTQFRRKYSSDSSSSSANSQCTIIRQTVPIDNSFGVNPLRDLCVQSLQSGFETNHNNHHDIIDGGEAKITIQKKFNSVSRNAPNIPIINELEMHYNDDADDRRSRENQRDKVITILQVPPDMKSSSESNQAGEKTRWYGLQSTQVPNLMLALSPMQKDYMASAGTDSQQATTSVDVLLDMHKKFVERRAYHEKSDDENSDTSRLAKVLKQENENRSDDNNRTSDDDDDHGEKVYDVEVKIARDSPRRASNSGFEVKSFELENELKLLDIERQELEEELKNLQSLQHFKHEEFIFTKKKLEEDLQSGSKVDEISQSQSMEQKYANDDFNEFINSNEQLHQEIYTEWQDKVCQRNERILQKTLKITNVNDAPESSSHHDDHSERAASEKYVPLRDEFISKVKERQKRLSLPIDDSHNWDASTESLLDDEKTGIKKKKKKVYHVESTKENFPAHFREFLDYCEQEIAQSKNSVESAANMIEAPPTPLPFKIAPRFKATFPAGIWSEQNRSQDSLEKKTNSPPPPPVWTPKSAPPSPSLERKFRPVPFESPTLARKNYNIIPSGSVATAPWTQPDYPDKPYQPSIIKSSSLSTISAPRIHQQNHSTLRKARAAEHLNEKFDKSQFKPALVSTNKSITFKSSPAPLTQSKSNELVYSIKQKDLNKSDTKDNRIKNDSTITSTTTTTFNTSKRMTTENNSPKINVDGIGPTTHEGMPTSLRSEVTDSSRDQWYKKMYNTIHKAKDDDNYVTVKYKTKRGVPYKSNGYASEPDGVNYDSDYVVSYSGGGSSLRYRTSSTGNQSEERYGSMEQPVKPNAGQYKVQPGRIEHYTPGKSSISDKEAKQWWDDIMEIFDGWLDEHSSKPICGVKLAKEIAKFHLEQQKLAANYTQGNLSRALKEQGYQSDSTLVFKKRSDVEQLSPVEVKEAYKSFQHGGEVPLHGFRKHAPERQKDGDDYEDDTLMQYKPRMKAPSHDERAIINSEIVCYPITNISRPLDMFGPFPKTVKSFVPVVPPQPPNRKSSRTNSTLKIVTHLHNKSPRSKSSNASCSKHDSMNVKFSSTSKKSSEVSRSRSAGPSYISTYMSSLSRNEDSQKLAKRICYRANSSSPTAHRRLVHERKASQSPVAFGRGLSKERAFAVEKKKVEEKLSKISKDLHVSTRILRNPSLRSPNEVKQAVQNTFKPIAYVRDPKLASLMVKKSLQSQAYQSTTATSMRNYASKINEQKSLKVTVAISSRGREIMRTSTETPTRSLRSHPSNVSTLSSKSSTLTKASDSTILRNGSSKLKVNKSKNSIITSSNNSLARTNSTYSIDSNLSVLKKKSSSSAKNVPITITSQKLKKSSSSSSHKREKSKSSFQGSTLDDNRKALEGVDENALQSNEAMKSNTFFQQLFLNDNLKKYGAPINPNTSVLEKARMWNALASYKSEPSLRQQTHYLHQSRPVSRSRFLQRAYEKRNESECYAIFNNSTNVGGREVPLKSGFVMEQIYKYDSLYQLSDEDEFGNSNRGRSLDFSLSYHERSNSEPPSKTVMTEVVRPYSPLIIYGRNKSVETTAGEKRQRNSRSPSCRRIQSLKTNKLTELSSYQKEIVRAQSVGRTDRAKERLQSQSEANLYRSKSLNILNFERHLPICGHKRNERFRDLRDFYACLERVGQLERATSHSDLRPRLRNEEIIDYDLWQKVREHEKNERELNILLRKLRVEQRNNDFLFQPHTADEIRWNAENDFGLVTKEKSVENLKELFQTTDDGGTDENSEASGRGKKKAKKIKKKKEPFDGTKDNYKPLWRGSSVLDLASNMTQKYNKVKAAIKSTLPKGKEGKHDKNFGLSRKLLSTLSKDQLKKIRSQLTEIYSSTNDMKTEGASNIEQFVVTVPSIESKQMPQNNKPFLTVRSHSELTKDRIQEPTVDISSLKNVFESKSSSTVAASEISESEKRSISHTLCQEIKDKFNKKKAINPDIERVKKIESAINTKALAATAKQPLKRDISFTFQEAPPSAAKYLVDCLPIKKSQEAESISSETSNRTVIFRDNSTTMDDVHDKIKYFEEIEKEKEKVPTTIYHAAEDSSLDEDENEKKVAEIATIQKQPTPPPPQQQPTQSDKTAAPKLTTSQSFTDLKDLFGERSSLKSNTFRGSNDENFGESRLMRRSRSSSPNESERGYKSLNEFGDVEKLKMKFENICFSGDDGDSYQQLIFSDSELNRTTAAKKIRIHGHEHGNVSNIAHKYEMQSKRARSRTRRISPIPKNSIKRDRLMPHINVISKTASLKEQKQRISTSNKDNLDKIEPIPNASGEVVAKIKEKFESLSSNLSLMGKMFTSTPEIRELNDISPHLSHLPHCGNFFSHRYPRREDNNRSIISPDKSPSKGGIKPRKRPSSTSPIRKEMNVTKQLREIFSDEQHHSFDSYDTNRSSFNRRYIPDRQLEADFLWQKKKQQLKSSTSFAYKVDFDIPSSSPSTPPLIPPKNNYNISGYLSDSQKKYVENDVNIHYKVPVRFELKHAIPDDELARQQAEHMKKVYQEERRRKYLQELQDMNSRRHTDNFTPSQKSPIALNRYDDFAYNLPSPLPQSSKSPVNLPGTVARALYSFQGQSARELSFKKGDIIYIRRQIDKNWYEGEHNANIGLLPVQYVDIISNDGSRPLTTTTASASTRKPSEGQARAKYNFVAQSDIELSLNKGELVSLTRRVDENWFEGRVGTRKGIFPVSYVEVLTDIGSEDIENNALATTVSTTTTKYPLVPASPSPMAYSPNSDVFRETKTIRKTEVLHVDTASEPITYRAIYNYRPVNSDELELKEGDMIYVLEKCDDGWFVGTNARTGHFGTFPGNYTKLARN